MSQAKVKVLLSAYNGEKYIAQQIDSILGQTYQNIELYVRDDGTATANGYVTVCLIFPFLIQLVMMAQKIIH